MPSRPHFQSSTLFGVSHVVLGCPGVKMARIHTWRIVAMVADHEPRRNRAIDGSPRKPMGTGSPQHTVATARQRPWPTFVFALSRPTCRQDFLERPLLFHGSPPKRSPASPLPVFRVKQEARTGQWESDGLPNSTAGVSLPTLPQNPTQFAARNQAQTHPPDFSRAPSSHHTNQKPR